MLKSSVKAFATRRWLVSAALTAALAVPSAAAWTAAPPPLPAGTDSGAQLNRAREYMEQQRVAQQIEEDQERQKAKVETEAQTPKQSAAQITFTLAKVETEASEILTEAEIKSVTDY